MVINMHIYQEENKIIITEGKSQVWIVERHFLLEKSMTYRVAR